MAVMADQLTTGDGEGLGLLIEVGAFIWCEPDFGFNALH